MSPVKDVVKLSFDFDKELGKDKKEGFYVIVIDD